MIIDVGGEENSTVLIKVSLVLENLSSIVSLLWVRVEIGVACNTTDVITLSEISTSALVSLMK